MQRRAQVWVSLLPLLACMLAVRTPQPALRSQSASQQRHRVQRPTRNSGVRLDGDHHHEETPHFLVPRGKDGDAGDTASALAPAPPRFPILSTVTLCDELFSPSLPGRSGLIPPGRAPPAALPIHL